MKVYYNEIDTFAVKWLKELMSEGIIPSGDIDDRSIADVKGSDLEGYEQCHFFAGIGGWVYALQLAGWGTIPVWTGSCPCQPLSVAGAQKGAKDKRHLWPEFARLICECEPSTIFGEQVASKLGREWLSGVRLDLEEMGYAVGAADLCAAGVGAPHIRQRLWWVADSSSERLSKRKFIPGISGKKVESFQRKTTFRSQSAFWNNSVWWPCRDGKWRRVPGVAYHSGNGCSKERQRIATSWRNGTLGNNRGQIEPALFPLADGVSNRVGILRGVGNAIVPQVAAEFIKTFMDTDEYVARL